MRIPNMLPFRRSLILASALLGILPRADGLVQSYCSTDNTGSDYSGVTSIWQSNGRCYNQCVGSYAFAIVKWQQCWCSNYIPASQSSLSSCNATCPGFPDELCGNTDTGYYGYIQLSIAPSGTAGGVLLSSTSQLSTSSEDVGTSYVSQVIVQTVTQTPSESIVVSYVTPTPSLDTISTSTSTSSPTTAEASTTELPPLTSVIIKTLSGAIVTQTVTTTPIIEPASHPDEPQVSKASNNIGAGTIAGIVIGVLAGLAVLGVAAFLLWRRRRKQADEANPQSSNGGAKIPPRLNVSVLSKSGLLTRSGPSMAEREHDESYYAAAGNGVNSVRQSMMYGGAEGVSPISPLDNSQSGGSANGSPRYSKPLVYDQRLNPSALFANQQANGSRVSMQDQQDYSRPLGVTNPDPRASFESRISHA